MQDDNPPIAIHSDISPKINFASYQSAFALLRDLGVENLDEDQVQESLLLSLRANPPFLKPKSWQIDRIAAGGTVKISDRDIELDGGFLLELADAMKGTIHLSIECDGHVLAEQTKSVELLAYNEWGGTGFMPELLAAFSTPNDPAIDKVLHEASSILRRAGKPDGIDGYASGKRARIWEITSAIYAAICNLGLSYAIPPASFEVDGQKIRLPGHILENRVATCLDTSLLFASALEQAGLNAIVALPDGHAFVGVWLQPQELNSIVIDEAETLRKRTQINELLLVETTFVTSHPSPPFSKAVAAAQEAITPEKDDSFRAAIDIRRARAHKITPLGKRSAPPSGELSDIPTSIDQVLEEAPPLPDFDNESSEQDVPETPAGRLERWQRKLLDLSARNPLLNHRSTKTSLRFICPDPGLLEDKLADGAKVRIESVPQPSAGEQDQELYRRRTGEVITEEYARDALDRNQLLVDLQKDELTRRAVETYRKAQTALQEGGANTLFMALGFLLWKRDEKDERRFRAPLILLPVNLERKSVRSGIKVVASDDETRFNTTLLEMLRKDFEIDIQGLDGELPTDSSGVDVAGIWNIVRKAVKGAPGFEVVEDVVLGHFSFAKYLMWKDLTDHADALRQSKIVSHLIDNPRDPYPSDVKFVQAGELDTLYQPVDLLTPLPADASQMAAIATADRGKDFVVIGPPGTGKSQTISNLIAHLLGGGKKVLFVSEKTAALSVVYRRLKDVGLGRFCLELHSNKARKVDVLAQLKNAWEFRQRAGAEEWSREGKRLRELRDKLNQVVARLHTKRKNGLTAHYAMGIRVRDDDLASRVEFNWPNADYHDASQLNAMREAISNLKIQLADIGDVTRSPFQSVAIGDWSPQWESQLVKVASELSSSSASLMHGCDEFLQATGIPIPDQKISRIKGLIDLANVLKASWRKQTAFALEPDGQDRLDALQAAISHLQKYDAARGELSCDYAEMAWREIDGDDVLQRWHQTREYWWLKRLFTRRSIIREMQTHGAQGKPDVEVDGPTLRQLREDGQAIDSLGERLSGFECWRAHATNIETLKEMLTLGESLRKHVARLADDAATLIELRGRIKRMLGDGNDLLAPDAVVGRVADALTDAYKKFDESMSLFDSSAGGTLEEQIADSRNALASIDDLGKEIVRRHAELRQWCGWRRRRQDAMDLELAPFIDAVESGFVPVDEIEETFEAAYCAWWSSMIIGEDDVLRMFSTPEHVETIRRFREIVEEFQRLTAAQIAAKLTGSLPDPDDVKRQSSWGVLNHEIQKKRRHKPVRQLIEEVPDVLTTLAPCLMMSPLSVAQYLPADMDLFDVVIFDEASQITVWDAVGSLARARQAIVAGDPKQMPPTNFFARSDDDPNSDVDQEGDLESILDECLGASVPRRVLNLHYRSRKESLIAFSNSRYYDDELITFPAPIHPDQGVHLVKPDGVYSRGKARHNQGEAKAIVAEIMRRLTSNDEKVSTQSIGVVTFNSEQQSLIQDLLDSERSKRPEIEWAFAEDTEVEPVFVKNLETVQGDERDVILFSVTYGPDESGHVTMNFGPLNKTGGERRLNVAMTRARSELIVFSMLSHEQIDLSRTQARAVADLKHFLQYAERGHAALGAAVHGQVADPDSPFEVAVIRALRDKGWVVHPQVGVSAFRIDLGIVHPDKPGIYLAGVECDGAMYHSSAYARERDKIRQAVLEGLGWTLYRVWSTDWWTSREAALDKLNDALLAHLARDRARDALRELESDSLNSSEDIGNGDSGAEFAPPESALAARQAQPNREPTQPATPDDVDEHRYLTADLDEEAFDPDPGAFYTGEYTERLTAMVDHVIDVEGPVHEDIVVHRIARHHGFMRAGRQIKDIVLGIAKSRRPRNREDVGHFYWPRGTTKDNRNAPARYMGRDEQMRRVEHICLDEIRAIDSLLGDSRDPVEIARNLGIVRLSQSARSRLELALSRDN